MREKNVLIAIDVFILLIYPPGEFVIINIQDDRYAGSEPPAVYVNYKSSWSWCVQDYISFVI